MADKRRQQRINQLLRDEISRLLRYETDDPALSTMISVTEVQVTQDLQKAKVFVSTLDEGPEADEIMKRLRKAARFYRREIAQAINLRHTPELEFVHDPSIARGARVLALLREHAPPPETPPAESEAATVPTSTGDA
ncbi:MAG: 30S ribosome-binding factor RbfA [Chloroflexi bacterium]|nr:30S ribosome-binding factor RbfA [Chloroflexota bacterium]